MKIAVSRQQFPDTVFGAECSYVGIVHQIARRARLLEELQHEVEVSGSFVQQEKCG